ncbi:ABC transporter substrate-binding protein [Alicyclobacillus sp. SP_1]|uniref:ABC transporter substrate-binding protein n=1 Tax=Alicyclobacillus sp. SP_1 TaxID=2942475 RepID=UPI002157BA5D|nr:ABC transporter substrate-binding protein [Alicyclobacillus sp. SP_1]
MAKKRMLAVVSSTTLLVAMGVAGCGTATTSNSSTAPSSTTTAAAGMGTAPLVIGAQDGSPGYTENFNPFSPNALEGEFFMYEPLYEVDGLTGAKTPWLATSYQWVGTKKLEFTIRQGVKWSNGKPFTAKDVVFTFDLLKKYPALDSNGIWSYVSSVSSKGNVVTFDFSQPNVPGWQYIAEQLIVYPGQFKNVNPVTFTDDNPIVTGPYVVDTFNPSQYTLKLNPLYWQKNLVKVPEITEIALSGNQTADLQMSEGKFDQAVLFEPGIQKVYVDKNPADYHYWFPLASPTALYFNLSEAPFNNVKFRQAMAYAINKEVIYKKGEYGYEPPASQSLLPPSLDSKWLDPTLAQKYQYNYSPKKALSLLESIGYHMQNGKLIGPNGKQLSFTLECPTGWTDYIQDMQIIQSELAKIGIKVNTETPSQSTDYNDVETGHFQAALVYGWSESNPYYIYDYLMSSSESAPIGKVAAFNANSERFNDPKANQLLTELAQTTSSSKQHKIVDQLEKIAFTQVPIVGLVSGAGWNEYQTNHYVGWPTASNPYASPGLTSTNALLEIIHLRPVK